MQKQENRRVANMTSEQISRKRAVDRSNQRSHRAKNKAYIRHLEAKVAELTYNLERAEDRLFEYESNGSQSNRGGRDEQVASPVPSHLESPMPQSDTGASMQPENSEHSLPGDRLLEDQNVNHSGAAFGNDCNALPLDFGSGIAVNIFDSPQDFTFMDLTSSNASMNDSTAVLESMAELPDTGLGVPQPDSTMPVWQQVPMYIPPTTKLDEIIINKTKFWRERFLKSGRQLTELGEPRFPSISSLLNQPQGEDGDKIPRPVSDEVAAEVLDSPIKSLVERIGFMYKLSYFVRWLVCQTEQTYNQMPDFMKPTKLQRTVPHPAWIDILTFPDARDELIRRGNWSSVYDTFTTLTGASISVTWPYPDSGAFMESADGQSLRLNPMFEAHIRSLGNWKLGKEVGEVFPFMKPYTRQGWRHPRPV